MAGPFARILASVLISGVNVVSRAFLQAYQQAAANAKAGHAVQNVAKTVTKRNVMSEEQALQVLNIERHALSQQLLNERYNKYFEANDPKNGGSFYLQSKIFRAKETLDEAFAEAEGDAGGTGTAAAAGAATGAAEGFTEEEAVEEIEDLLDEEHGDDDAEESVDDTSFREQDEKPL